VARLMVYACDFCGIHKGKTNDWWDLYIDGETVKWLCIQPFDANSADRLNACGVNCVGRAVAHYVETRRLEPLHKQTPEEGGQ